MSKKLAVRTLRLDLSRMKELNLVDHRRRGQSVVWYIPTTPTEARQERGRSETINARKGLYVGRRSGSLRKWWKNYETDLSEYNIGGYR